MLHWWIRGPIAAQLLSVTNLTQAVSGRIVEEPLGAAVSGFAQQNQFAVLNSDTDF
jgi:hypothetical protein